MAITTIADALAKCIPPTEFVKASSGGAGSPFRGFWYETSSSWGTAGATPTAGLAGEVLSGSSDNYFRYTNPQGGQKKYLCKVAGSLNSVTGGTNVLTNTGSFYIADRLWHNNGLVVTSTSPQTIDSVAWPARDVNGTSDGDGVWLGMELSAIVGATTTTATISYTNSAGVAGRTGIIDMTVVNNTQRSTIHMMFLAAGDTGVRSVQTFQFGVSLVSGAVHLVAFCPLAFVYFGYGRYQRSFLGPLDIGFPEFPDNCCPMVGANGSIALPFVAGEFTFAEG